MTDDICAVSPVRSTLRDISKSQRATGQAQGSPQPTSSSPSSDKNLEEVKRTRRIARGDRVLTQRRGIFLSGRPSVTNRSCECSWQWRYTNWRPIQGEKTFAQESVCNDFHMPSKSPSLEIQHKKSVKEPGRRASPMKVIGLRRMHRSRPSTLYVTSKQYKRG